jgi:hypothetical protein
LSLPFLGKVFVYRFRERPDLRGEREMVTEHVKLHHPIIAARNRSPWVVGKAAVLDFGSVFVVDKHGNGEIDFILGHVAASLLCGYLVRLRPSVRGFGARTY